MKLRLHFSKCQILPLTIFFKRFILDDWQVSEFDVVILKISPEKQTTLELAFHWLGLSYSLGEYYEKVEHYLQILLGLWKKFYTLGLNIL